MSFSGGTSLKEKKNNWEKPSVLQEKISVFDFSLALIPRGRPLMIWERAAENQEKKSEGPSSGKKFSKAILQEKNLKMQLDVGNEPTL